MYVVTNSDGRITEYYGKGVYTAVVSIWFVVYSKLGLRNQNSQHNVRNSFGGFPVSSVIKLL